MGVSFVWAVVAGFLMGVFVRSLVTVGWWGCAFLVVLAVTLLLVAFYFDRARFRVTSVAAVFLVATALGVMRMQLAIVEREPLLDARVGTSVTIEGVVANEPDARENNVRIPVRVTAIASSTTAGTVSVLVIAPLHTVAAYGDKVRAHGKLQLPRSFDAGAGREFNYPGYLAKDGILYELSFAKVAVIGTERRNPLKAAAIYLKHLYLEGIGLALPEPEAGLAGGITAGDKRGLGAELSETFRIVGLIHIVVLSGYNIMVVIGFLDHMLRGAHRYLRFSLGIIIAAFFALMTGLASSSVRAASMAVIATIGKATGRTYLASRALAIVAFGMVLWNPYVLAFDPGFQLSIIATWGLISVSPLVAERLRFVSERFGLREIAAATIGTQIAVLPILLYQSGSLSLYSLPANVLTLMMVPYAMLLSCVAGIAGLVAGPIAPIIGFPAYVLLWYITSIAHLFAWLPFSSVAIPAFSFPVVVVLYSVLVMAVVVLQKKTAETSSAAVSSQ